MGRHVIRLAGLQVVTAALLSAGAVMVPVGGNPSPPDKASSVDERDVVDVLSRASAVALAEVESIAKEDHSPLDGPLKHAVKLRLIKSSGEPPATIDIIISSSGRGRAVRPDPPARVPLSPNPLIVGQRYWFAWGSQMELEKFPNRMVGWWPESAAPTKTLDEAVRVDRYQWHPQYEPITGRRYGYRFDEKTNSTTIRIWKGDALLGESVIEGKVRNSWVHTREWIDTFGLFPGASSLLLELQTDARYYVDFDVCKVVVIARGNGAEHLDPKTGKRSQTVEPEAVYTGGRELGAATDQWTRVRVTKWDNQGKKLSEETFRAEDRRLIPIAPATRPSGLQ